MGVMGVVVWWTQSGEAETKDRQTEKKVYKD